MKDLDSKLEFKTSNSYLVFKILFDYYEKRTKLATTRLTWENIGEYKEVDSLRIIFIPPFPKGIKNPLALMISKIRIAEYLDEYSLNSVNK